MKSDKKKIIVIGNGMVGHRFCEKFLELDKNSEYTIEVFGEEPYTAYDRVHLSEYFKTRDPASLELSGRDWYEKNNIQLNTGRPVASIHVQNKTVTDSSGMQHEYDTLIIATGSKPFVPTMDGSYLKGVFVYRTIEDLEAIAKKGESSKSGIVIGGGLLGLEAAKALLDMGMKTHIVELSGRLMPRQLDEEGASFLQKKIEALGIEINTYDKVEQIVGTEDVRSVILKSGKKIPCEMVVISAGIIPRDELAVNAGLKTGERGGIAVNDQMQTSDPSIYAIGEVALHRNTIHGLVAPGYAMADTAAKQILGLGGEYTGSDGSTLLKLLGVDTASFGNPFLVEPESKSLFLKNSIEGKYKKLVFSEDGKKLLGGILVGDVSDYGRLKMISESGSVTPISPVSLLYGDVSLLKQEMPDMKGELCKCNNVSFEDVREAVKNGCGTLAEVKNTTKASQGCGGCSQMLADCFHEEMKKIGKIAAGEKKVICEHFNHTRQEMFEIIKVKKLKSFDTIIASHGKGRGCEICKPLIASLLASAWNEPAIRHEMIQDTNDRFMGNIQRGGSYSIIPRVPGGEVTPEQLIRMGETAKKYKLYGKITGGQRIGFFGAKVEDLPAIWEDLVEVGLESGHAYGKAMRTVKSCVGSAWCRFGVQDSVSMAIRIEERYRGLRAPHKMKSGVSGCIRECAEAQSKDFGVIATEKGWNLYVCGNGGIKPQHTELLASDLDDDTLIRYIDRFLIYYLRTSDKLTRTATWLNQLEGGMDHLREVVIGDSLGIGAEMEAEMDVLAAAYKCEWKEVVENPELRLRFRHFANSDEGDPEMKFIGQREMKRPAPWAAK